VNAAKKQTVKIFMTGDCADGQMVEGVDEDDCEITVSMTPKTAKRSAVLEVAYDADEPEWEELDAGSTKSGRLIFGVSSTDEDDFWMDGVVLYRVRVKKSGVNKQVVSKEYKTAYTSADAAADDEDLMEDLATEDPEEQAFNEKMDGAKRTTRRKSINSNRTKTSNRTVVADSHRTTVVTISHQLLPSVLVSSTALAALYR
jgi:hypothetical protein